MRVVTASSVMCLLILAAAHAGNQDATKKEIELLRGTWTVTSPVGANDVEVQFAIYGDESFEINIGGNHLNGVRTIDPTKSPKEITLTPDLGKMPLFGIYKVKDDTLTLCFSDKRPLAFKAQEGTTLWEL